MKDLREQIKERCPHIIGVVFVGDGWLPIIIELLDQLDDIAKGLYEVKQIKEKFGGLRFYLIPLDIDIETWFQMRALVKDAEDKAWKTCEECGMLGAETTEDIKGWLKTLCKSCHQKRNSVLGDKNKEKH